MKRRHLVVGSAILGVLLVFSSLRQALGLDLDPDSLQDVVGGLGVWGPIAYVGIVAFRAPLGLPSAVVLIGGGAVFGTVPATLYGSLGLLVSGSFFFYAARTTGSESILARLPASMGPLIEVARSRVGALLLIVGTGAPVSPMTLFHLVAGVTGMAFVTFLLAGAVGAMIRAGVYTFFGAQLVSGELRGVLEATAVAFIVMGIPMLFPRSRAWLLTSMGRGPSGVR